MSLNAATIAVLLAKGFSGVDILEVAQAMECRADRTNQERQARHRAKKKSNGVTVTANGFPNDRDILTPPEPSVISNEITPPVENPEIEIKPEHVLEAFNAMADRAGLPKARMTPERRKRLHTFTHRHPIDDITEAIHAIECSPFCRGENDRGWKAGIDFLLQPKSFTKLIEGTYGR